MTDLIDEFRKDNADLIRRIHEEKAAESMAYFNSVMGKQLDPSAFGVPGCRPVKPQGPWPKD